MAPKATRPASRFEPSEMPTLGARFAELFEAAIAGDGNLIRQTGSTFVRSYHGGDQEEVTRRINSAMRQKIVSLDSVRSVERLPLDNKTRLPLIEQQAWPTLPLLLEEAHGAILSRFVLEAANSARLSEAGLAPRFNLLLSGPPGTGKTFIAGHIAARLGLPFYTVRLDSVISSLLGDTAKNIRSLFDYIMNGPNFLFLDEFDAVAKSRDDNRELGEIKRVVNALIQSLDEVNERSIIVAATNHSSLLDPAIFRRFPYQINIDLPGPELRAGLWQQYLYPHEDNKDCSALALISDGLSCSDIRELAWAARRSALISETEIGIEPLLWSVLQSSAGRIQMPTTAELESRQKEELRKRLHEEYGLSGAEMQRLTGTSRQAILKSISRGVKKQQQRE